MLHSALHKLILPNILPTFKAEIISLWKKSSGASDEQKLQPDRILHQTGRTLPGFTSFAVRIENYLEENLNFGKFSSLDSVRFSLQGLVFCGSLSESWILIPAIFSNITSSIKKLG